MTRTVQCVKLKRSAPGLSVPPYPGELGKRIWQNISQEVWDEWKGIQTRLVNENRLNLADARARAYLQKQMEHFLFEDGEVEAQGFTPPAP
jgi:Fe-S cluster biosynthesis and repair protein YggX